MAKTHANAAWPNFNLTVSNDVLYDHGRLMYYVVRGAMTMPSGAMMDEDYSAMLRDMGGSDTGSMVPQLRWHMVCACLGTEPRCDRQH